MSGKVDPELTLREIGALRDLRAQLKDAQLNVKRSVEKALELSAARREEKRRLFDKTYQIMSLIYQIYIVASGSDDKLRRIAEKLDVEPGKTCSVILNQFVSKMMGANRQYASKIALGIRFGYYNSVPVKDFAAFVKRNKGVNGCAEGFRRALRDDEVEQEKRPVDATSTKKRALAAENERAGDGRRYVIDPSEPVTIAGLEELRGRARQGNRSINISLVGWLDPDGRVRISRARERSPAPRKQQVSQGARNLRARYAAKYEPQKGRRRKQSLAERG